MKSVLQTRKECWVCRREANLDEHHIFHGTSNRSRSEEYGMKVWLCPDHHNMSNAGVHFNKDLDSRLKCMAQAYFEENIGSREDFRKVFGKSFI